VADTVTDDELCQLPEPPDTEGAVGVVLSIFTLLPAFGDDGPQLEVLPAASVARICTMVDPSAVIVAVDPVVADDHVDPASAEVRYS
jgi:hypothetical protein